MGGWGAAFPLRPHLRLGMLEAPFEKPDSFYRGLSTRQCTCNSHPSSCRRSICLHLPASWESSNWTRDQYSPGKLSATQFPVGLCSPWSTIPALMRLCCFLSFESMKELARQLFLSRPGTCMQLLRAVSQQRPVLFPPFSRTFAPNWPFLYSTKFKQVVV